MPTGIGWGVSFVTGAKTPVHKGSLVKLEPGPPHRLAPTGGVAKPSERFDMADAICSALDRESWALRVGRGYSVDDNGCWIWNRAVDHNGYGVFTYQVGGRRRYTSAHRASWLAYRGDIPVDLVLDHLCRVRSCVNPSHLEIVTSRLNIQRGYAGRPSTGGSGCRKHDTRDGYRKQEKDGYCRWVCRICRRRYMADYYARQARLKSGA